jgi:hypothetical protein
MSTSDLVHSFFASSEEGQKVAKPSGFDFLTKLVVPALSLVAVIIAQLQQQQRAVLWGLLGFAFLSLAAGFYPAVKTRSKTWIHTRRGKQVARQRFPEFKKFVRQFGEFVDMGRNDTLHYIISSELYQGNVAELGKLGLPTVGLFNGFWYHFNLRIDRMKPSLADQTILEFYNLVGSYNNTCAIVAFERLPQASLTPQVRSSLNAFQQRFVPFLEGYQEFLKDLVEAGVIPSESPIYFAHPKPL